MKKSAILAALFFAPALYGQTYQRMQFHLQNVQGQSIAGAQVTVYNQSACGGSQTTQATLYPGAGGGSPLTQPLTTDHFGQAYAYVSLGCYTVVYTSPYTGTQTYVDQTPAGGGGSGAPGGNTYSLQYKGAGGGFAGDNSINTDGSGSLSTGKTNGTLEASSCYSTAPASWCPAAGSTLDVVLQSAFTALPNGGKVHIAAGSYNSKDWNFPTNTDPRKAWEIWGDGRSTVINMQAGSTYWANFSTSVGDKIHDLAVIPAAGMVSMVHMQGANQDSLYDNFFGYVTDPQTDNGIGLYWLDAAPGFGNYQNTFSGNRMQYLTGIAAKFTDSSTDGAVRDNSNVFTNEWWNGEDISGVLHGTGLWADSGTQNDFQNVYIEDEATCIQTAKGTQTPIPTQFYGNRGFFQCDPGSPTSLTDMTGSYGNHFQFGNNQLNGMPIAQFRNTSNSFSDAYTTVVAQPVAGIANLVFGEHDIYSAPFKWFESNPITPPWTNPFSFTVAVDIWAGVVSNVKVNGVTVATHTGVTVNVPSGQALTVTSSVTPFVQYREPNERTRLDSVFGLCLGDGHTDPTLDVCLNTNGGESGLYIGYNGASFKIADNSGNLYGTSFSGAVSATTLVASSTSSLSGHVGIGVSPGSYPLEVNGIEKVDLASGQYLQLQDETGGDSTPNKFFAVDSGVFDLWNSAKSNVLLSVDDAGNTAVVGRISAAALVQPSASQYGGTCAMASGTSCTITIAHSYTTPVCIVTQQSATLTGGATGCTVSGTTVTITAATANSETWGALVFGNPN